MDKISTNINGSDISDYVRINFNYWSLGTRLITFILMFVAVANKSAVAKESIVSENQQAKLTAPQNPEESESHQQLKISLRQKLLAHKKNRHLAKLHSVSFNDGFIANVQPETFSNSFAEDKFLVESANVLASNDNFSKDLLADPDINRELPAKEQANISQPQEPQVIAQIDSSGTVGDTFGDTNQLRQELLIDPIVIPGERTKASPGSSAGTPSGYGASFGQAYIGGGLYFPLERSRDRVDGSLSVGFGLGDAAKSVGLEVNVNITSVGGGNDFDFGDSGGVGFKLHKYFSDGTAVAVGWSNPIKWGDVNRAKDTIYGVVTRSFPLQPDSPDNKMPLTVSVGLGSGAFRSKGAIDANENAVNLFASLGLRVIPQVSLVSSWTGNRLNMGASFAPFQNTPIVINAIFTDVTSNLDTGLGFSLSAGYTFRF
ncbi:hypothetical protein [Anabaena subtropica]|uniref:Uncharacterized protein n=1 Tax=Anabaena subtropica FACHB-260 TaxID=2692884 RepID=A0ABR8CK16_9NOST|nr:hypothetical protein [Anabaena subtropica]MBD2343495.1 hypothetical protein [Anabaena subtropica FACHB-260]